MSRNEEKQKNELNRLYLSKIHPPKAKRPHLTQIHTVEELRRWLPFIEREIHSTLAQTTSVRYTDEKVESMYKRITQLESEHKKFRRKIAQLELGPNVNVLTTTVPVEKSIHFYKKKSMDNQNESLDDIFKTNHDLPLLSMDDYRIVPSEINFTVINNDKPLANTSLVDYSDSD